MENKKDFVSVVFSFRNEEENIPELIRQTREILESCTADYELLFVNDCSTDGSLKLLEHFCAEDQRVRVITLSRRFGYNQGFLIGMKYAAGDIVITMDADLQDPPHLIPKILEKYHQGADVVHTVRTQRQGESWIKSGVTILAYKVIRLVAGLPLLENAGNFKLFSRRAVDQLLRLGEKDPYFRGLAVWVGFPQAQVSYVREKRFAGKTHFPVLRSSGPVKELISGVTSFSLVPLVAPLVLALPGFAAWAAALVWAMVSGNLMNNIPVFLLSFVLLVILGFLGVFGLYIHRIWNEVNARPFYIVESTINMKEGDNHLRQCD